MPTTPPFDLHCHLGVACNAEDAARMLGRVRGGALVATLSATDFAAASRRLSGIGCVRVAVGLHPWAIADGTAGGAAVDAVVSLLDDVRYVGEVGLDFGKAHGRRQAMQREAFARIVRRCANLGDRVLSVHGVHAAGDMLDILEQSGVTRTCAVVLHRYSGPTDELWRAIGLGCLFSVSRAMLDTKRGREQSKLIPAAQLLLETDRPEQGRAYDVPGVCRELDGVLSDLERAHGSPLREQVCATSRRLLEL